MTRAGRLLDTGVGDAAWNMAVDEALLEGVRLGMSPPTLRVYRWSRPTLSLGRAQQGFATAGVATVRRPTGGRAVLHAGDFTYAIATDGLPPGVRASYTILADALGLALAKLGVPDVVCGGVCGPGEQPPAPPGRSPDCFAAITSADMRLLGNKLIGSAQARREQAVLQHGSLYLRYPQALAERVFGVRPAVADLATVLGREPGWEELTAAFAAAFGEVLGLAWGPGELSGWELDFIKKSA